MTDEQSSSDTSAEETEGAEPARFERRSLIGSGGLGDVYLVHDHLMERDVAVKSPRANEEVATTDREGQFVQEARLTGQLEHPNIVPAYDLIEADGSRPSSLIMKYVDGEPYSKFIERLQHDPSDESLYAALQVFLKVCDAVSFAHEKGVIHCDLKPENVMVGKHGQVHVMDWGAALRRSREAGSRGKDNADEPLFGSLAYMAPEQLTGDRRAIDVTTDVYGLGGILCALVTGQPPRHGVGDIADWRTTPSIEDRKGAVDAPPELCRICEEALHPSQGDRYPSVAVLKSEVETFLSGGGWFQTLRYLAGDVIVSEGDLGTDAFIITEGMCDVFKGPPGDSRRHLRSMGPGEAFGEVAVLVRGPRTATVVARTDVVLRVITPEALERELRRNPVLSSFMSALTERFADLDARLDVLENQRAARDSSS